MAKRAPDVTMKSNHKWTPQTLPRLLLILGSEAALRAEAIAAARSAAFGEGDGGMSWVVMQGPASPNEAEALTPAGFLDEACTASMFAAEDEMKVVLVRQADVFLSDKEYREILERSLPRIPLTTTLILEAAAYGSLKSTNFFKALEKSGAVVACESLVGKFGDSPELEVEVGKRSRERGLELSHGALLALLERSSKNLGILNEELEKLVLALSPAGAAEKKAGAIPVTEEDVAEYCAVTRTYNSFDFANAAVDRDARKALEVLGGVFDRGLSDTNKPGKIVTSDGAISMLLLGALTWKLNQLQDVQAALDAGQREWDVFGALKVFGPRQEAMRRTLKKYSGASVRRAMNALLQANLDLRRGGAQPQEVLEQLVWALARG